MILSFILGHFEIVDYFENMLSLTAPPMLPSNFLTAVKQSRKENNDILKKRFLSASLCCVSNHIVHTLFLPPSLCDC